MNDQQIRDYVRARTDVDTPPDLLGSILDAVDRAPARRSWLASWAPIGTVAAAMAMAAVALVLLMGPSRDLGGPSPDASTPGPTRTAEPTGTHSSEPPPASAGDLIEPGQSIQIAAVDSVGEWGSIRIERGEDLGGYPDAQIPDGSFVIELWIEYDAERLPDPPTFGASDWALRPTDPNAERFFVVEPQHWDRISGSATRPEDPLPQYPGAIDPLTTSTEGRIAFAVDRRTADLRLELLYWPSGFDEPAETVVVRLPGNPPPPVEVTQE